MSDDVNFEPDLTRLAGTRILVTGAAGFLGGHLCQALSNRGAVVIGVTRQRAPTGCRQSLLGDCANSAFVRHALESAQPEIVFHLAGSADGSRMLDHVVPGLHDDLVSTVNVLTAAAELGVGHVLVTGTMEEPDFFRGELTPSSPYAAAKLCVNFYARLFHSVYSAPVTLLRPFFTYGPGQHASKVIPSVIRSLAAGQSPRLSSCRREVDLVFVGDMIDAFVRAAVAAPCAHGIDLGSGRLTPLRAVIERIRGLMQSEVELGFGQLADRPDEQVRAARIDRAVERLDWRATTPLDDGLQRTISWYTGHLESTSPEPLVLK